MLKIRLSRTGKKNYATFRLVLTEHTASAKGKAIEVLGSYNPHKSIVQINPERIKHWLSKGVKLSPTVHNMLVDQKVIDGPKVMAWKPPKKETPAAEAQKPAEAAPAAAPAPEEKKAEPEQKAAP